MSVSNVPDGGRRVQHGGKAQARANREGRAAVDRADRWAAEAQGREEALARKVDFRAVLGRYGKVGTVNPLSGYAGYDRNKDPDHNYSCNPQTGGVHRWGTDARWWGPWDFVAEEEGLTWQQAQAREAKRLGLGPPEEAWAEVRKANAEASALGWRAAPRSARPATPRPQAAGAAGPGAPPAAPERDWGLLFEQDRVTFTRPAGLAWLARKLGADKGGTLRLTGADVPRLVEALVAFGFVLHGWSATLGHHLEARAPQRGGDGRPVGYLRRLFDPKEVARHKGRFKLCPFQGGLGTYFDPADPPGGRVALSPEGPTDAAFLKLMGLLALGRANDYTPANVGQLAAAAPQAAVIFLAENDRDEGGWPGRDGAWRHAQERADLTGRDQYAALVPDGQKDTRDWFLWKRRQGDTRPARQLGQEFLGKLEVATFRPREAGFTPQRGAVVVGAADGLPAAGEGIVKRGTNDGGAGCGSAETAQTTEVTARTAAAGAAATTTAPQRGVNPEAESPSPTAKNAPEIEVLTQLPSSRTRARMTVPQ
jgi:hypothetical protein